MDKKCANVVQPFFTLYHTERAEGSLITVWYHTSTQGSVTSSNERGTTSCTSKTSLPHIFHEHRGRTQCVGYNEMQRRGSRDVFRCFMAGAICEKLIAPSVYSRPRSRRTAIILFSTMGHCRVLSFQ